MKTFALISLSLCLLLNLAACGSSDDSSDYSSQISSQDSSQADYSDIDNSNGYVAAMAAAAGFDMEVATVDDIVSSFGDADSSEEYTLSGVNYTKLTYSFGTLYFEERESGQVLAFVNITDTLPQAIFGINIGDSLDDTADAIYPQSSEAVEALLESALTNPESRQTTLYGDGVTAPYGTFGIIDAEQSSADGMYVIECAVTSEISGEPHTISFTFSSTKLLTQIAIKSAMYM